MKNILIVDDDHMMQKVFKHALSNSGYNVMIAENGQEGLDRMNQGDIDFAIIDYAMPVLNGLELVKKMLEDERLKDMPFVMVSGNDKKDIIDSAYEVGVKWFLRKSDVSKYQLEHYIKTIATLENIDE